MGNLAELLGTISNQPENPIEKAKKEREEEKRESERVRKLTIINRILEKIPSELHGVIFQYSDIDEYNRLVIKLPNHHEIMGIICYEHSLKEYIGFYIVKTENVSKKGKYWFSSKIKCTERVADVVHRNFVDVMIQAEIK